MKLSLEQRAVIVYVLGNFGTGMIFTILLSPQLFDNSGVYFVLVAAGFFEFLLMCKINIDAFKHGLVKGFCMNSRNRESSGGKP